MTVDQWLESLRKRAHDHANVLQKHEGQLVRIEERQAEIVRLCRQIEQLKAAIAELRHQSLVLKWALACVTAVGVGVLVKMVP